MVSAKLHYCYSNAVSAAFSAPVLLCHPGTPPFFWFVLFVRSGWFLLLFCFVLRLVGFDVLSDACGNLPCPHLGARRRLEWIVRVCRSVLFDWLLTKVFGLRGTDIAVFTRVTKDGISVLAPPRVRFFALPLFFCFVLLRRGIR